MSISEYEIADVLEHDESSKNQNEQKNNIVHIINLNHKSCKKASIEEILNPRDLQLEDQEYVFLILDPSIDAISKIRIAYGLHPILDYECSYSSLYSIDHMFKFDDCLFIALIDIPGSEDLIRPALVKILLIKNIMFLIVSETLDCIEEVFCNDMGLQLFNPFEEIEARDLVRKSTNVMRNLKRKNISLVSNETIGLGLLENILYKIIHVMFIRTEEIIAKMDEEVANCIDFVTNLSINETNEFIIRMNYAQKNLALCTSYVSKKPKLFLQLTQSNFLSKTFSEYLISMSLNMAKLEKRIKSSKRLLKSYEYVYRSFVDEGINQSSRRLNRILQVFSAMTAIFLPLNLLAGYMGMNVKVPFMWDEYETLWPFTTIIMFCVAYFIFIVVLFKKKSWL